MNNNRYCVLDLAGTQHWYAQCELRELNVPIRTISNRHVGVTGILTEEDHYMYNRLCRYKYGIQALTCTQNDITNTVFDNAKLNYSKFRHIGEFNTHNTYMDYRIQRVQDYDIGRKI